MKTLILGIGNPILQDDGVGLHVVQHMQHMVHDSSVVLDTAYTGGLNLLDHMRGYDRAILIDAVRHEAGRPGDVHRFSLSDTKVTHAGNPHDVSLPEALLLARRIGEEHLPKEIIIVGIVVNPSFEFGEQLSDEVEAAIPRAVQMVLSELKNTQRNYT